MTDRDYTASDYIRLPKAVPSPAFLDAKPLVLRKSESQVIHELVETSNGSELEVVLLGTIVIDQDWDKGEGEFRWRGRSPRTGQPNQLIVNWSTYEMSWYLAEFTNLNNEYWAHPSFVFQYEAGNRVLSRACYDTVAVPDEDAGNEPTFTDTRSRAPRRFTPEADTIRFLYQGVHWTYFNNGQTCAVLL